MLLGQHILEFNSIEAFFEFWLGEGLIGGIWKKAWTPWVIRIELSKNQLGLSIVFELSQTSGGSQGDGESHQEYIIK